jgi:hypothetical protein
MRCLLITSALFRFRLLPHNRYATNATPPVATPQPIKRKCPAIIAALHSYSANATPFYCLLRARRTAERRFIVWITSRASSSTGAFASNGAKRRKSSRSAESQSRFAVMAVRTRKAVLMVSGACCTTTTVLYRTHERYRVNDRPRLGSSGQGPPREPQSPRRYRVRSYVFSPGPALRSRSSRSKAVGYVVILPRAEVRDEVLADLACAVGARVGVERRSDGVLATRSTPQLPSPFPGAAVLPSRPALAAVGDVGRLSAALLSVRISLAHEKPHNGAAIAISR